MTPRRAFGLIELLAVVGFLAIVIGAMLPALGRIRQSAQRTETMNHLRWSALGIHSYHDNFRKFPDAYGPCPAVEGDRTLWFQLLPFVEQENAYRNDAADTATVPPYLAADDPYLGDDKDGKLNFAANIRVFGSKTYGPKVDAVGEALEIKAAKEKILNGHTLARIPDGTTNTLMLITRMSSCDRDNKGAPIATKINADPGSPSGGFFGGVAVKDAPSPLYAKNPTFLYQIAPKDFDELRVGQSAKCVNAPSGIGHSLTGQALMVSLFDGSVRTITPKMSAANMARAICPGDGQAFDGTWDD